MTRARLLQLCGLAGFASGVLLILLEIAFLGAFGDQPERVAASTSIWLILLILSLLSAYLGLLALVGLYSRQAEESGQLGLTGFLLGLLGAMINSGYLWAGAFIVPALTSAAPGFLDQVEAGPPQTPGIVAAGFISTFVLLTLGWIVFGVASLRANVLPKAAIWLAMLGALLSLVSRFTGIPLGSVLFGLGLAWLGWWLWREKPGYKDSMS
jgi:hypothetical protein